MIHQLKKDLENIENCMIRLGDRTDIWQDRMIYVICKAVFDLLRWAIRKEKALRTLEQMQEVSDAYWTTVEEIMEAYTMTTNQSQYEEMIIPVRCKDCRYYDYPFPDPKESADAYPERWCCLLGIGGAFGKDDYCSHGERKDG